MAQEHVPEELRAAVDAVVEHLAVLRGGGLFLSGTDGRLLVHWLEHEVPPAMVMAALEKVAERRRKRRVKTPLRLESCKGEVERLRAREAPPAPAPPGTPAPPPAGGAPLDDLVREAWVALERLPEGPVEVRAEAAMAVVRDFHRRAWDAAAPEHGTLRAAAEAELAPLRGGLDPARWAEAVEEVARDLLRQRWPLLSAGAVWDRLHGS